MPTLVRMQGLALALIATLATSGCVAAGLATGPLMSAVQLIGDRTVERTVTADLAAAQGATEAVLARMAFRIEDRERHEDVRSLRAVTDGLTVHAKLERVTAALTRIGLRVEVGRVTADRDTGTQMQEQIAALLGAPVASSRANDPVSAEALTTLQTEIQKLRSSIEARAADERSASGAESGTTMRVETGGNHDQIRLKARADVGDRGLEHTLLLARFGVRFDGHVHRVAAPAPETGFAARAGSRIPRILMHRKEKHRRVVEENPLRAVAVMNVPVDDRNAFDLLVAILRVTRGDRDVVEKTKAHRAF